MRYYEVRLNVEFGGRHNLPRRYYSRYSDLDTEQGFIALGAYSGYWSSSGTGRTIFR